VKRVLPPFVHIFMRTREHLHTLDTVIARARTMLAVAMPVGKGHNHCAASNRSNCVLCTRVPSAGGCIEARAEMLHNTVQAHFLLMIVDVIEDMKFTCVGTIQLSQCRSSSRSSVKH